MVVIIGYGMIFIMPLLGGVDMAHTKCLCVPVGLAGVGPFGPPSHFFRCGRTGRGLSAPPPIFYGVGAPCGDLCGLFCFVMSYAVTPLVHEIQSTTCHVPKQSGKGISHVCTLTSVTNRLIAR